MAAFVRFPFPMPSCRPANHIAACWEKPFAPNASKPIFPKKSWLKRQTFRQFLSAVSNVEKNLLRWTRSLRLPKPWAHRRAIWCANFDCCSFGAPVKTGSREITEFFLFRNFIFVNFCSLACKSDCHSRLVVACSLSSKKAFAVN
jgi:hypothetical protein